MKGQSGNPKGRPKDGSAIAGLARSQVERHKLIEKLDGIGGRVRDLEGETEQIQEEISGCRPVNLQTLVAALGNSVAQAAMNLKESLIKGRAGDLSRAKKALSEHMGRLILTPAVLDGRPVYQVSRGLTLARPLAGKTTNGFNSGEARGQEHKDPACIR
jgi:hypothetical protein